MQLCPDSTGEDRAYKVTGYDTVVADFAKVYPNPARDLINLVYFAETTGPVEFEVFDQLGNVVIKQNLGTVQNYAQYSTEILGSGMYYWTLKDSQRTIKADKVVIIK